MEISPALLRFLKEDTDLIATGNFIELYRRVYSQLRGFGGYVAELTWVLEEADIQPLDFMTSVPHHFCYDRKDIENFTIPSHIKTIEDKAFYGCTSLKAIQFPQGLESIGSDVFRACYELQEVTLPNSLQEIGRGAFSSIKQSGNITYMGSKDQLRKVEIDPFAFNPRYMIIHCTDGDLGFYRFKRGSYHGLDQWDYEWTE